MNLKERKDLFTKKDVIKGSTMKDYEGQILVLKAGKLGEQHRTPANQIWKATHGFGCSPHTVGTAVYATCLGDGERTRWERYDFMGVLKPELVKELELEENEQQ